MSPHNGHHPTIPKLPDDPVQAALLGREFSSQQARLVERYLQEHPDDVSGRASLLCYYTFRRYKLQNARQLRQQHLVWLIDNKPAEAFLSRAYGIAYFGDDPRLYRAMDKAWRRVLRARPGNSIILFNAARFYIGSQQYSRAKVLIRRVIQIEPRNLKWREELSNVFTREAADRKGAFKTRLYHQSFEILEKVYRDQNDDEKRFYLLSKLAKTALEAGQSKKAAQYARVLLRKTLKYRQDWNYGNAIHHGNIILGRIAHQNGHRDKAFEHLRAAGKTIGSPQLNSFGPNMKLADELIRVGERKKVLEYLKLCAHFWKDDYGKLKKWNEMLRQGTSPDFGPHLNY